jgi:hypothetical protein
MWLKSSGKVLEATIADGRSGEARRIAPPPSSVVAFPYIRVIRSVRPRPL